METRGMWPLSSQASLHHVSEVLEDLNHNLDIERLTTDVVARAYGKNFVPKLIRILSAEDADEEKRVKTLNLLLTALSDDLLKVEWSEATDGKVFLDLLKSGSNDVKKMVCSVMSKLCNFTQTRNILFTAGLIPALLESTSEVPEATAECFNNLSKNKDIIDDIIVDDNVVPCLLNLLKSQSSRTKTSAALSLAALARKDEGIEKILGNDLAPLFEGIRQDQWQPVKEACITTLMQICHGQEGKVI